MAVNQCNHRACRNPIRSGQTYCWVHGGASKRELDDAGGMRTGGATLGELDEIRNRRALAKQSREWPLLSRPPAPTVGLTTLDRLADAYTRHLPVREDAAGALLRASRKVLGKMSVEAPAEAAQHRGRLQEIAAALADEIGHGRVNVVEMRGLVRRTATRPRISTPAMTHQVIVIDAGTENEVVADPFIAALAPVRKEHASAPVIMSGMEGAGRSPFVDAPWMGTRDEYDSNGFMEWRDAELLH